MAHGRPRDPRKEQQWRQWIQQWQSSGLGVREFCSRHGLPESRFYVWRQQLQRRQATLPSLVPVHLLDTPNQAPAATLEVVLGAGQRTLRVPPGFDASTLRQLLAILEELPPC